MPSKNDVLLALNELVDAVYDYSFIDEEWSFKNTREASKGRQRMEAAAQRIMIATGTNASRADLDLIFSWEPISE